MTSPAGSLSQETILKRLVRSLVENRNLESGEFDKNRLKSLKSLLKNDQELCSPLVDALFVAFNRDSSDVRLSAILLANEIFVRMHKFRLMIIDNLQDLLLLCAETDPVRYPLPVPREAAKQLKKETLRIVQKWHETYGKAYKKLELAHSFLSQSKSFEFSSLQAETLAERQKANEREERLERVRARLKEKLGRAFGDAKEDIERCCTELRNGLGILLPDFRYDQDDDNTRSSSDSGEKSDRNLQLHGLTSRSEPLQLTLELDVSAPQLKISSDNEDLIKAMRDCVKLAEHRYLAQVNKWLAKLTKIGGDSCQALVKQLITIKTELDSLLKQYRKLNLCPEKGAKGNISDDSDFEDVPEKEELMEHELFQPDTVPQHLLDHSKKLSHAQENDSDLPGPSTQTTVTSEPDTVAPKLSFGIDLKYWGKSQKEAPTVVSNETGWESFWARPIDDDASAAAVSEVTEGYRTRLIPFVGNFEPIERECGAILASGKKCTRRDKFKCPLHGPHKDRDTVTHNDAQVAGPSWRDPELEREIEAATGVKLGPDKKNKKKRQIPEARKTRKRLETKLFDKKSLRRVSAVLDAQQQARNRRKFEHQFNYTHKYP